MRKGRRARARTARQSYRAEVYENDAWKRQDGSAIFTGEGNHYVMSNSKDKDVMEMLFVDLGKARYVVQTQDHKQSKDPYIYFFADVHGSQHLSRHP